jgi:hypothetical protein
MELSDLLKYLLMGLGVMKLLGIHSLAPFRWSCPCEKEKP